MMQMAPVDISNGSRAGAPEPVYPIPHGAEYAAPLTREGEALILKAVKGPGEEPINVMINWMSAIRADAAPAAAR